MKIKEYESLEKKQERFQNYKRINTIEEFRAWHDSIKNDGSIFRGIYEARFMNYTSAQRLNIINDYEDLPYQTQIALELDELRNINNHLLEKYCSNINIPCSDLYLLSFAQHYGGISPLLDFTLDINKALFFMIDGLRFTNSGSGDETCSDISNYCSIYYFQNDEIGRSYDYIESVEQGKDYETIPQVMSILPIILYHSKGNQSPLLEQILSYQFLSNWVITPPSNSGTIMPLLIENKPVSIPFGNGSKNVQLMISNLNIESQDGCFIFHSHYDDPLEHGLRCIDIHKSLAPFIEQRILSPKGINSSTIYPNNKTVVQEALKKSLAREDYMQYYHW